MWLHCDYRGVNKQEKRIRPLTNFHFGTHVVTASLLARFDIRLQFCAVSISTHEFQAHDFESSLVFMGKLHLLAEKMMSRL